MNIVDDDGRVLDAEFSVDEKPRSIVYESAGGRTGVNARNRQYSRGLVLLLRRLGAMRAIIQEIHVDSLITRRLRVEDRRVALQRHRLPLDLASVRDFADLKRDISTAAREPGARDDAGRGGSSRRLRFFVKLRSWKRLDVERAVAGLGIVAEAGMIQDSIEVNEKRATGFKTRGAAGRSLRDAANPNDKLAVSADPLPTKSTAPKPVPVQPTQGYLFTFGYGSNMCLGRIQCRIPSATPIAVAELRGFKFAFHKKSQSKSGKANAFRTGSHADRVLGVVLQLHETELQWLHDAEGLGDGYDVEEVTVREVGGPRTFRALAYIAQSAYVDDNLLPFTWYKRHVIEGARHFGLDPVYIGDVEKLQAKEDPVRSRAENELRYPCDRELTRTEHGELNCHDLSSLAASLGPDKIHPKVERHESSKESS